MSIINAIKNNKCLILLFILIYTSDDTMLFGTYGDQTLYMWKYVVLILCSLGMMIKGKRLTSNASNSFFLLIIFYILSSLFTGFSIGFIYSLVLLLTAILFANNFSLEEFKEAFCKIVFVLALFSIAGYLINLFIPELLSRFPMFYNLSGNSFRNCYLYIIFPSLTLRNFGIFREPGAYMIYLNTALILEWFSKNRSIKRSVIYLFALLTTVSTAGILIGSIIIIGGFLKKRPYSNIIITLPIVSLAYYFLTQEDSVYYTLLFDKLEADNGTTIARVSSLTVPLQIFLDYPLGCGPSVYNELFPVICNKMYGQAIDADLSTNTFLKILSVYGIFVFILYFRYFIRFVKRVFQDNFLRWLLFLVLVLALSNEDFRASIFFCIMIAYGLVTPTSTYIPKDK